MEAHRKYPGRQRYHGGGQHIGRAHWRMVRRRQW